MSISSQNKHVLGSIHEMKCNECDKNNYVDFDGHTKQKATSRIKDQAYFITYQKKIFHFCQTLLWIC